MAVLPGGKFGAAQQVLAPKEGLGVETRLIKDVICQLERSRLGTLLSCIPASPAPRSRSDFREPARASFRRRMLYYLD